MTMCRYLLQISYRTIVQINTTQEVIIHYQFKLTMLSWLPSHLRKNILTVVYEIKKKKQWQRPRRCLTFFMTMDDYIHYNCTSSGMCATQPFRYKLQIKKVGKYVHYDLRIELWEILDKNVLFVRHLYVNQVYVVQQMHQWHVIKDGI